MKVADLSDLIALVPPPEHPSGATGDWDVVEMELGMPLPDDYKNLISTYGEGTFAGAIRIDSPFNFSRSAREAWGNWADIYRDIQAYGTVVPFEPYPACPGLLPCASLFDRHIVNWLTQPVAGASWPLIYYEHYEGFFDLGGLSLTTFIVLLCTGSSALPPECHANEVSRRTLHFRNL